MKIFTSLNEIIFPDRCISCGALGISICSQCRRGWNPHHYVTQIGQEREPQLKVTSSIIYSPIAQKVILAAKESHIKKADELVAGAIAHSIRNIIKLDDIDAFVPIPSRKSAVRLRGRQFVAEMTHKSSIEFSIPSISIINHSKRVRDQSSLDHTQRWNNLQGAFVVEAKEFLGKRVLLIDDLVTTGATLSEAHRALKYAGIEVVGAVTAAVARATKIT
jgi:predicted amidophosphoribosyltransferase